MNNKQNDLDGLIGEIAKLGYEDQDLAELRKAVVEDKGTGKAPVVTEGKTGEWFAEALKKAAGGPKRD